MFMLSPPGYICFEAVGDLTDQAASRNPVLLALLTTMLARQTVRTHIGRCVVRVGVFFRPLNLAIFLLYLFRLNLPANAKSIE